MLQKQGSIDWAEAKRRLIKSARQDTHTGVCWNSRWGYGKLDEERLLTIEPESCTFGMVYNAPAAATSSK